MAEQDDVAGALNNFRRADANGDRVITKAEMASHIVNNYKKSNPGDRDQQELKDDILKALKLRDEVDASPKNPVGPRSQLIENIVAPAVGQRGALGSGNDLDPQTLFIRLKQYGANNTDAANIANEIADSVRALNQLEGDLKNTLVRQKDILDTNKFKQPGVAREQDSQNTERARLDKEIEEDKKDRLVSREGLEAILKGLPPEQRKALAPLLPPSGPSADEIAREKLGLSAQQTSDISNMRNMLAKYKLDEQLQREGVSVRDMANALGVKPTKPSNDLGR
ncbi:MAG: hypothetical protein ACOYNL_06870 [Rickettsiales bacterium]